MSELDTYYSLDEVIDRDIIIGTLKKLKRDGRIEFIMENGSVEYFKIFDIDLEEHELEDLLNLFDENDVYPYLDIDDENDDSFSDDLDDWNDDY
jgi:hypothetical protein